MNFSDYSKKKEIKKKFHYFQPTYDSKERFCSYWHQINEILQLDTQKILEVGIGNGFVTKYLREKDVHIISLDISHELGPDVVANVLDIPFLSHYFNVVSCYEVLEHIPYNYFTYALSELSRISKRYIIISIPDITTAYKLNIELPKIKPIKNLIEHPFPRMSPNVLDNMHYWEIGATGYPLRRIENDIYRSNLQIKKTYRIFEHYYHRIFVLQN
jgi:ubiquinone/menaquinone biosynthesis C-methylase UbiE